MPCLWHVDTVVGTHDATEAVGPRAHDAVEAGADAHDAVEVVAPDAEEPLVTDIVELVAAHDKVERVVAAHNKIERVVAVHDAGGCPWRWWLPMTLMAANDCFGATFHFIFQRNTAVSQKK